MTAVRLSVVLGRHLPTRAGPDRAGAAKGPLRGRPRSSSWCVDETYVKVRGQWAYLYRALDKLGNTVDFYLSATRNTKAAKRFLGKALRGCKEWELPEVLNTDKAPTYGHGHRRTQSRGQMPGRGEAPVGEIPQQCHRGGPRQP